MMSVIIVVLQWSNIFDSETCYEEQALERERERERQKAAQGEGQGGLGQRTSSDPAVNSIKVKKGGPLILYHLPVSSAILSLFR